MAHRGGSRQVDTCLRSAFSTRQSIWSLPGQNEVVKMAETLKVGEFLSGHTLGCKLTVNSCGNHVVGESSALELLSM